MLEGHYAHKQTHSRLHIHKHTDAPAQTHTFRGLWLSSCLGSGRHLYCWSVMDETGAWTIDSGGEKFPLRTLCTFNAAVDGKSCLGAAFWTRTSFPDMLFHLMKGEDKSCQIRITWNDQMMTWPLHNTSVVRRRWICFESMCLCALEGLLHIWALDQ